MRDDMFPTRIYPNLPQVATIPGSAPVPGVNETVSDSNDNGGFFVNMLAKLDAGFNSVTSELKKTRQAMRPPVAPVFGRVVQPIPLSATGFGVARLGGPDMGHYWYVRSIVIGGLNDPSVTVPGRGDVFVSAADLRMATSLAMLGIADWRDMATTLPNVDSVPPGELALRLNEELFIVVSGGTANGIYTCACSYIDYQESNNQQDWSI